MKINQIAVTCWLCFPLLLPPGSYGQDNHEGRVATPESLRQYTFAWPFQPESAMAPRGGTTNGQDVQLDTEPDERWQALQEPGISKQERDRRAILAMSGPYRASFDFIETMGFTSAYTPPAPYQSWGTEYVYVIENKPDFVSLQHILVMFVTDAKGAVSDPIVVKHWRQDWHYENRDIFVYTGHNRWQQHQPPRGAVKGTWSQAVYQVDDSPRYASFGSWRHDSNVSTWRSAETWRPLPRREFSVRSDYHVLVGYNQHTITPSGWVHTEDNKKVVLGTEPQSSQSVIAIEAGLNRYERISNHDWSAGDNYWAQTAGFWQQVRNLWDNKLRTNKAVTLHNQEGQPPLLMQMFALAGDYADKQDVMEAAAETLNRHTSVD